MINNAYYAIKEFNKLLKWKGIQITRLKYFNKGRHCLFITPAQNFYVVYKRDWFRSFNQQFPEYVMSKNSISGYAESINKEYLKIALKHNALLVFVHPHNVYYIHPKVVRAFCEEHKLVRTQDKENVYKIGNFSNSKEIVHEVTYSFPTTLLENFKGF